MSYKNHFDTFKSAVIIYFGKCQNQFQIRVVKEKSLISNYTNYNIKIPTKPIIPLTLNYTNYTLYF